MQFLNLQFNSQFITSVLITTVVTFIGEFKNI